ncbi:hypothetical protein BD289DRAFT_70472 [Coniella lustricola]|uniref:Uncharacterized protein n=1 Tax=Coniella lustricola TaxID=2025994 RepID=A0A2T2ZZY0_9PEZI|nr:hypothetical protein BD289DRAFT_70472 [Coniella lustricola]
MTHHVKIDFAFGQAANQIHETDLSSTFVKRLWVSSVLLDADGLSPEYTTLNVLVPRRCDLLKNLPTLSDRNRLEFMLTPCKSSGGASAYGNAVYDELFHEDTWTSSKKKQKNQSFDSAESRCGIASRWKIMASKGKPEKDSIWHSSTAAEAYPDERETTSRRSSSLQRHGGCFTQVARVGCEFNSCLHVRLHQDTSTKTLTRAPVVSTQTVHRSPRPR